MRVKHPIAAALALTLVALPATAQAQSTATELDRSLLDAKLEAFAAAGDHSVLAEVRLGDQVWSEAIGPRSLERRHGAVEVDDRVRVASLTKSMIATVLLQLDAEGALDLDDPIEEHLPGLLPYEDSPTVRQLAQHVGGLNDYFPYLYPSLLEGDTSDVSEGHRDYYAPAELIAIGTQDPALFEPGEDWSYSNTGYIALGLLIEEVTGNSVRHELTRRVFWPAGMFQTYFPHPRGHGIWGPSPTPYMTTGDPSDPYFDTAKLSHSQMWTAGAVLSTMEDVNDFYEAMLDGRLLSSEQVAEAADLVDTGFGFGYGLGLLGMAGCSADDLVVGHTGGGLGHQTFSLHSLDTDRQITFTYNADYRHDHIDFEQFDRAYNELIVAGLCGIDAGASAEARTMSAPDFTALLDLAEVG